MGTEAWNGAPERDRLLLAPFVPALVRRRIALDPTHVLQPTSESSKGALLLADLSGFSSLAEAFARRGPRGAEDLNEVLNFFCGHLVDLVDVHGGEVLDFAGDAALAFWPVRTEDGDESYAARRASQCALAVQQLFRTVDAPHAVSLNLRCGVGAGQIRSASVGGVAGHWALLVTGEPLMQAVNAISVASAGDIAVSSAVWSHIGPYARGGTLGDGRHVRLESVIASVPAVLTPELPLHAPAHLVLRAFVPPSVQARLDARQSEWLSEFRRVTALFVKIAGVEWSGAEAFGQLQRATVAVQTAVYRHGGSVNQVLIDDKGTVVVCGWG